MASYVVTVPLAIVRDAKGAFHHLYKGNQVPEGVDEDHLAHLVADGAVSEAEPEEKADKAKSKSSRSDKSD